jgi:hypothetical protein
MSQSSTHIYVAGISEPEFSQMMDVGEAAEQVISWSGTLH